MKKKNTTKTITFKFLLKVLLVIIVVAGTILLINYFTNEKTKDTVDDLLGLDPNATTEQEQEVEKTSKGIAIPGFEKLIFQSNSLTQDVSFENPEQNDVYFIISLSINDEIVYESQLIEPGKGIYSIELPTSYPAGEYTGKLIYETRSMSNTNEKKNGATINVPVIFE